MGQNPSNGRDHEAYQVIEQLPIGNIISSGKDKSLHFLKQYSFSSQEAYHSSLNLYSTKLSNKNQHVLNFQHFTTKSENSFCSTFYKIMLIYQYIDYSLEEEIELRIRENRPFTEKEIWSVLCSCVLAAVHLINTQGKMHSALSTRDIRLTPNGCVKLLAKEMIGISKQHAITQQAKPKDLGISLLHCLTLQPINNDDSSLLAGIVQTLDCSGDMKDLLHLMISKKEVKFVELEEQLFKLVQEDDSIPSQSNTPALKSRNPIDNNHNMSSIQGVQYKCPKIQRHLHTGSKENISEKSTISISNKSNNNNLYGTEIHKKNNNINMSNIVEHLAMDREDQVSTRFQFQNQPFLYSQLENPDETDLDEEEGSNYTSNCHQSNSTNTVANNITNTLTSTNTNHNIIPYQGQIIINKGHSHKIGKNGGDSEDSSSFMSSYNTYNNTKEIKQMVTIPDHPQKNIHPEHHEHDSLFTDPKLFSMIQNDLKQIETRKSMVKAEPLSSEGAQQYQINDGFPSVNHQHSIEIIKESSQQYSQECHQQRNYEKREKRERNQGSKDNCSEKVHTTIVHKTSQNSISNRQSSQNIMSNQELGFKRKKSTNRDHHNIILEAKSEHNPTFPVRQQHVQEQQQAELVHVTERYQKGKYTGTKLNNKRHGHGTFYYSEGGKYVGNWKYNKMHGYGVLYYPNSSIAYEGNWKSDQLSGYGVLYNEDVTKLRNPFDYRDFANVDDYWIKYQGNFQTDNKHGAGKLYLSNGERFQGGFQADTVDGDGVLHRDDGSTVRGKWKDNKLMKLF